MISNRRATTRAHKSDPSGEKWRSPIKCRLKRGSRSRFALAFCLVLEPQQRVGKGWGQFDVIRLAVIQNAPEFTVEPVDALRAKDRKLIRARHKKEIPAPRPAETGDPIQPVFALRPACRVVQVGEVVLAHADDDVLRLKSVTKGAKSSIVLLEGIADVARIENRDASLKRTREIAFEPRRWCVIIAHQGTLHHRVAQHHHAHRRRLIRLGPAAAPGIGGLQ